MKNVARLAAIALCILTLAGVAVAQEDFDHRYQANIPFQFQAGLSVLPAGRYTFAIDPLSDIVLITRRRTLASVYVGGLPADPVASDQPRLTFASKGNQYQLAQIQDNDIGVELLPEATGNRESGTVISATRAGRAH
jgi:hypothetical protein